MKSTDEQILQQYFPITVNNNVFSYTFRRWSSILRSTPIWQSCLGIRYNRIDVLTQHRFCFVVFGRKQEETIEIRNAGQNLSCWIRTTCYLD